MHDKGKILAGIGVFLLLVLLPVWYSAAQGSPVQEVRTPEYEDALKALRSARGACVQERETMIATHMDLLDTWRDQVVREGETTFAAPDGREFEMSLTRTCLGCHATMKDHPGSKFCTSCHDFTGAAPNCWDCHNEPGGR